MMAPSFLAGLYLSAGKEVSQKACGGEFYSFPLVSSVNEFRRMELELSAVGTKKRLLAGSSPRWRLRASS
jgi:hypothetical protein